MVFDTHTHAWTAPTPELPWTNGPLVEDFASQFSTDIVYRAEDLLADMDAAGVDDAVVVGYPICDWTDNSYTIRVAGEYDRLMGIVMIDQFADDAAGTLRETLSQDGIVGFRLGAVCPYDEMWQTFDYDETWLRDAIAEEAFWETAIEMDAVVQILAHTSQLDQVQQLVERYPELRYALDHWCHADASDDPGESFAPLEPLAEYDTVSVKVSEIAHCSNDDFPYTDAHGHLRWLLEHFGREQILWGSDFPNVSHPDFGGNTYAETRSWLDHVPFLSDADRRWLCEDAPRAFFEER